MAKENEGAPATKPQEASPRNNVIVITAENVGRGGEPLPVGTELDRTDPWVARCILPHADLWEPKSVYDLKKDLAEKTAKAAEDAERLVAEARAGAEG